MKAIVIGLLSLVCMHSFAYTDINTRFYFDTDIDTLSAAQLSQLEAFIGNTLYQKQYKEIYVIGYTDADGTNLYNMDLSNRRARYVTNMLLQKGIPEAMIDRQYQGEEHPAATNNTDAGKTLNRRVEIILRLYDINKAADIIRETKGNPEEKFIIDNTKQSVVEGEKGIKIIFPPNCFQSADNKNFDPKNITVKLEEVRTVQDAIFSNVLSQSNTAQPLESGGMFRIKVYTNGKELTMKPNMQYTVQINNKTLQNNMTVFTPTPNKNGLMSWTDTKDPFKKDSMLNCERPYIVLDPAIINNWTMVPHYAGILESYSFRLPQAPAKVTFPKRPKDVSKPIKNLAKYEIPWAKRFFMTKAAEQKLKEEMYEKEYAVYQKQHDKYLAKLQKYEQDSACIAEEKQQYLLDKVKYTAEMHKIAKDMYDYKQALWENSFLQGFASLKKMLMYKSDNHILRTNDLFAESNNYLWAINIYKRFNFKYMDFFDDFSEEFYKACKENCPGENFYIKPPAQYTYLDCSMRSSYYNYNAYFNDRLRENKTVVQHFAELTDNYMKAQVDAGVFDPANFTTFYQASLNKFDWVNCDRYYNTNYNTITVQVPNYDMLDKNIYAIVKDMNTNVSIPLIGNKHVISLPSNKEIIIVAVGLDKNYTPLYAEKRFKSDKSVQVNLEFKNAKISEIRNAISNI